MELYGWKAHVTELTLDGKQYAIYALSNTETGESRLVYNWGKRYTVGQWKVDVAAYNENSKIWEKEAKGYLKVKTREPVRVTDTLLERAGIDPSHARRTSVQRAQVQTPVEVSHLAKFQAELAKVNTDFATSGVTPEVLVAFTKLRVQLADLKRELTQCEGRMEMLTAMIQQNYTEAQA